MEKDIFKKLQSTSYLSAGNITYIEQLYDTFLTNPKQVSEIWRNFFETLQEKQKDGFKDVVLSDVRKEMLELSRPNGSHAKLRPASEEIIKLNKQIQIQQLINAYRAHGHHHAKLDPLDLTERIDVPDLHLSHYGFVAADLDKTFNTETLIGPSDATLRSIYNALLKTYSDTVGTEYMHITDPEQTHWIQQRLESVHAHPNYSPEKKKHILKMLIYAEGLEQYLGSKYVGQIRFSLEGGVSLIPMLDELVQRAGTQGVKELIIGMSHRGRLNVLVNLLGKPTEELFNEFQGKSVKPGYSGDVKYHMGYSSNVRTPGGIIHLALAFNPSHLEIINPVVEGSIRARQDRHADNERIEVVPILIHGDAAFAGQGVNMETLAFSQARGFRTGGTVHIVVNNQIGFTTSNPLDARSSLYCTDIGKMIQAPIFHVNADDAEAAVFVMQVALDYRMTFKKDVIIDLVCYRRHGHNEADEPSATQPLMYRKIKDHPRTGEIYSKRLVEEGVIDESEAENDAKEYRDLLDNRKTFIDTIPSELSGQIFANWKPYKNQQWSALADTSITKEQFDFLCDKLTRMPEGFILQAQVAKEYENRTKMAAGEIPINWGFAEALAFGSLLKQGYPVRMSGQDSGRGTFAHRHAILYDQNDGGSYIPLKNISNDQAQCDIYDSILSEEAVLGFEYGYATTDPETLVIWEAQYGDFYNGAQVVVDQFITSGEQKWSRLCGLVMFLPHGYEGAGPEHSSARLERFLQDSAQENIQVCVPSTPAQMFHMLRRQILRSYRKPLIVMTPKSLLRNKFSTSAIEEFTQGEFRLIISEIDDIKPGKTKRVILCSGKVYYDLLRQRRENQQTEVAIIRVEQLYPFPKAALQEDLKKYKQVKQVVWCQEESQNQGAWYAVQHHLLNCLSEGQTLKYIGRPASAAPATGYSSIHLKEQADLVKNALSI